MGSHEIGGNCIQISSGKTTILLDAGLPLSADSQPVDLSRLFVDALLVSHPHQDHFGLMASLPPGTPVYIGKLARGLIDATQVFLGKDRYALDFHDFKAWQPFTIGDFAITPYLVDHSAADAYAFLIEVEGARFATSMSSFSKAPCCIGITTSSLTRRPSRNQSFRQSSSRRISRSYFRPPKTSTALSRPIGPASVLANSSSSTSTPHGCLNNSARSLRTRPPWTGPKYEFSPVTARTKGSRPTRTTLEISESDSIAAGSSAKTYTPLPSHSS